jgi:hypothetical protein
MSDAFKIGPTLISKRLLASDNWMEGLS